MIIFWGKFYIYLKVRILSSGNIIILLGNIWLWNIIFIKKNFGFYFGMNILVFENIVEILIYYFYLRVGNFLVNRGVDRKKEVFL